MPVRAEDSLAFVASVTTLPFNAADKRALVSDDFWLRLSSSVKIVAHASAHVCVLSWSHIQLAIDNENTNSVTRQAWVRSAATRLCPRRHPCNTGWDDAQRIRIGSSTTRNTTEPCLSTCTSPCTPPRQSGRSSPPALHHRLYTLRLLQHLDRLLPVIDSTVAAYQRKMCFTSHTGFTTVLMTVSFERSSHL